MPPTCSHEASRTRRLLRALVVGTLLTVPGTSALAAKWRHCPSQLGYYPSTTGATSAPFIHPGRELGIFLNDKEVGETGGFSTQPNGNTVRVTFASLFGNPIALPPFAATAVTPATLYIRFPDTRAVAGRLLAGPVSIDVASGGRTTAQIAARHLVALPPPTDVKTLVSGGLGQAALATMDTRGAIW